MKKILKRTGKIFCLFLLIVVLVNILSPLFCRKPDETYVESLRKTEFTSETAGVERICCIDDNEEALLWRLRMIGTAKESIVLSTFDLRADDNGTKILAALNCAAARGVKIQLLIDGIYQQLFLAGSSDFQALASYENVEVGVYNPVTPVNLFKVNYRMHDKYLIVDVLREEIAEEVEWLDDFDAKTGSPAAFDLASLVQPGERIADYTISGTGTNWGAPSYQCIVEEGSTDIHAALEDTMHRIIDARAATGDAVDVLRETMGAMPAASVGEDDGVSPIDLDLGYVLPGAVTSFAERAQACDPSDPLNMTDTAGSGLSK